MSDEAPARVVPPSTYPGAAASSGYSPPTPPAAAQPTPPPAAAQPTPLPQAPVAPQSYVSQPVFAVAGPAPSGGAAIAAGVLALVIGLYRAWQTYLYFTVVSFFGAFNGEYSSYTGEYSSYTKGPQTFATITAIASLICTIALLVGAVMLFNRRSGGRKLITLGCLIAIVDVIVTWIVVMQFMRGLSSSMSSLFGEYGSSSDNIFSAVMSEQGPSIAINIALGVGLPLLTMILALSGSTRRWCEAPRTGMPAAYGAVQPTQPSWSRPNDQPWQQNYAPPQPPSAPVAGWEVSSQPPAADPHAEFHRQAAEHFGAGYRGTGHGGYSSQPPYAPRLFASESFVTRLMDRGMRGELFPQPWFHRFRAESPDQFVYISYGAGFFVSIVLALIPSLFVSTVLSDLLWLVIGYLYLALGTKLAHQFLAYGICVVGVLVMLSRMWSAVSFGFGARVFGVTHEPLVLVLLELLMNGAGAAFLVFVGVQVHKRIHGLSAS